MICAEHIVNGVYSRSKEKIEVKNPATGKTIGLTSESCCINLDYLEERARIAQRAWHYKVTEQQKEEVFRTIIQNIEKHRGSLARTMILEGGKLWRWADAEVQEVIDTLWHYHGELSRCYTSDGFTRCQLPDKNSFSIRQPYGLILAIKPWNFPMAVPMWSICGALAGGNAIVLKAAEQTPFTAKYTVKLVNDAIYETLEDDKLRESLTGLVQLVQGKGETSGKFLVEKLNYDKLSFTGSAEVGNLVASIAAKRGKPAYKEAGGHAAIAVLDDFDVDLAVAEAINANLGDSGQRCVSTRVVFVQESIYKSFVSKYIERARVRIIGDPMDFKTEMGPLISEEQLIRVKKQVIKTMDEIHKKPAYWNFNYNYQSRGYYCSPVVFVDVPYGITAMDEEIFGPVIVINPLPGRNREEAFWNAVNLINQSKYGLSNALLTNDRRLASLAPWHIKTGLLYIGRGTTGAELNKYFGGIKFSGWGREAKGIDEWTQITQVYDDYHGRPRMAQTGEDEKVKKLISKARSPLEE